MMDILILIIAFAVFLLVPFIIFKCCTVLSTERVVDIE